MIFQKETNMAMTACIEESKGKKKMAPPVVVVLVIDEYLCNISIYC